MANRNATISRVSALSATAEDEIVAHLNRDGVAIVTGMFPKEHVDQVRQDLQHKFNTNSADGSPYCATTTRRVSGLFGISNACVDLAMHPLQLAVVNKLLTSTYHFYVGSEKLTSVSKPTISATAAFRLEPGGIQQGLHRDDVDYHTRPSDWPMLIGCFTALTRVHAKNGAIVFIPGSNTWIDQDRRALVDETVPAELEPGDTVIYLANTYHGLGGNTTQDECCELVGIFMGKGFYRQTENEYLAVPPERCKEMKLSAAALRVLGYAVSPPFLGYIDFKDPVESIFGIDDDETVKM
ncbi:unnamed protein product [Rotaria socialis]|uniref:Phytanoyl-CoA dioxygenase n=1 Tax=Rotaria socialis TaxID=392032 RepID=A0A819B8Y5_9BILA|nr:unnamed protein product [Rotaria socialis]CAF3458327.1 unnamed protein product [Rotaria socialis]CAF3694958.1 unnamed protein product [Rotaria socialis]CAF3794485.1 unnamed protein product [Rotaria socialis]CAF4430085.1 unnamed protein product [Rotaria socialis]